MKDIREGGRRGVAVSHSEAVRQGAVLRSCCVLCCSVVWCTVVECGVVDYSLVSYIQCSVGSLCCTGVRGSGQSTVLKK